MSIEIILFLTITALAAAFGISVAVWSIINTRRKSVENSPKTQRIYLDADVTPTEAATMLYAVYGPLYTDRLIDALIDVFEIQPATPDWTNDKSRTYDLCRDQNITTV